MKKSKQKHIAQKPALTLPAIQRLEAWMGEVTSLLCYQPEVPLLHKEELVKALEQFKKEL